MYVIIYLYYVCHNIPVRLCALSALYWRSAQIINSFWGPQMCTMSPENGHTFKKAVKFLP